MHPSWHSSGARPELSAGSLLLAIAAILAIDFKPFRETTHPTFFSGFLALIPERRAEDQ